MTPRSPSRRAVALVSALALLAAVLLARGVTAVDGSVLAEARESARAESTPPSRDASLPPSLPTPLPDGRVVVRPDGVDGLRLGMSTAEVAAAGFVVEHWRSYHGCSRVTAGLADRGPGEGVSAWLVEGRVAAVSVDDRVGEAASFLGPGPGDLMAELPDDLRRATVTVVVPWQADPWAVPVATLRAGDGVRIAFADTRGDGTIGHVQVREDAAAHCGRAARDADAAEETALPELGPDGWGAVRLGRPLSEVPASVGLRRDGVRGTGCELVMADHEPGLLFVVIRDGVVRAVVVDRGATVDGLRVGEPPERVKAVYGPTTAYLLQFWRQGLSADWGVTGADGERVALVLYPGVERVHVAELDAVVTGPRQVLGSVQLGGGC